MMSLIIENTWLHYIGLTCLVAGGAAFLMGRALATGWRPFWHVLITTLLMGAALRFLHFALFNGTLASFHYYISDTLTLLALSALGYQITRTSQMVNNYHWLYKRTSMITWTKR